MYCEDLLAPALLAIVVARGDFRTLRRDPAALALALFLLLAGIATLTHFKPFPGNAYHWCVYAYLAVTFIFFRGTAFPTDVLFLLGAGFLVLAAAACCFDLVMTWTGIGPVRFSLISAQMDATAMPFLRQRFTFTFGNPNLLGSFYALPFALLLLSLLTEIETWRRQAFNVGAALVLAVIRFCLVSKHALSTSPSLPPFRDSRPPAIPVGCGARRGCHRCRRTNRRTVHRLSRLPIAKNLAVHQHGMSGHVYDHQAPMPKWLSRPDQTVVWTHGAAAPETCIPPSGHDCPPCPRPLQCLPDFNSFVTFMAP